MDKASGQIERFFPAFWTIILCVGLAFVTLNVATNHPERLYGWRAVGFGVLLIALLGSYGWYGWGRLYGENVTSERQALFALGIQILVLLLLVWQYDSSFVWFSFSIAYEAIGGLPKHLWSLPLVSVVLIILIAILLTDSGLSAGTIIGAVFLIVTNVGIARFILLLRSQRDQLRTASEQLLQAHVALAANAVQAEELAVLRERARIARTMHDDVGHALVLMNVKLEAAQLLYANDPTRGAAELEATRSLIRDTMVQLRHTLADLRAPITDHDDLPAALTRLAKEIQERTGITVICSITPTLTALPTDMNEALWYVAREALTNVERHAAAANASLTVEQQPNGWKLRMLDDGSGINPADLSRAGHYGVMGMRERIQAVGGTFNIQRGKTGGTIVEAFLPVMQKAN
jgi:signal transduction histidine kinase